MNEQEVKALKRTLVIAAAYYGTKIDNDVLALYVEDLIDLPFDKVNKAINDLRRSPKQTRLPLPAMIRNRITPYAEENADDEGRIAAANILAAISKFGHTNKAEAREYIGELGWRVVESFGGWAVTCESVRFNNKEIVMAQYRDQANTLRRSAQRMVNDQIERVPERQKQIGETKPCNNP